MLLLAAPLSAAGGGGASSLTLEAEDQSEKVELLRLRLVNTEGGEISVSEQGRSGWRVVGHVVSPCREVNQRGFAAAVWGKPGCVVATAVNAIHVKVAQKADDPAIFSILPQELLGAAPETGFYAKPLSSIVTDVPAGEGIFGGGWSPFVGNPVFIERHGGLEPLPGDWEPQQGDVLEIRVEVPWPYPRQIVFENRFGGLITISFLGGEQKVIGQVLKPVVGVGRFTGGIFAHIGRIRANHCGVIDISTSRRRRVGGFQIVPAVHAMNPDMDYIRIYTQWMVVGPLNATDASLEGVAPLFSNYIRPDYKPPSSCAPEWRTPFLGRFLVEMRFRGGPWKRFSNFSLSPDLPLPGWAATALKEVTHIRILFPILRREMLLAGETLPVETHRPRESPAELLSGAPAATPPSPSSPSRIGP